MIGQYFTYVKCLDKKPLFAKQNLFNAKRFYHNCYKNIENNFSLKVKDRHIKLVGFIGRLENLSPLKTMLRGYSIVENLDGKVIKSVNDLSKNDEISIRLNDGKRKAKIL